MDSIRILRKMINNNSMINDKSSETNNVISDSDSNQDEESNYNRTRNRIRNEVLNEVRNEVIQELNYSPNSNNGGIDPERVESNIFSDENMVNIWNGKLDSGREYKVFQFIISDPVDLRFIFLGNLPIMTHNNRRLNPEHLEVLKQGLIRNPCIHPIDMCLKTTNKRNSQLEAELHIVDGQHRFKALECLVKDSSINFELQPLTINLIEARTMMEIREHFQRSNNVFQMEYEDLYDLKGRKILEQLGKAFPSMIVNHDRTVRPRLSKSKIKNNNKFKSLINLQLDIRQIVDLVKNKNREMHHRHMNDLKIQGSVSQKKRLWRQAVKMNKGNGFYLGLDTCLRWINEIVKDNKNL